MVPEVPEAWQEAAEEVRAHLCALRGGGPFLSPADALQLVQWLEGGVDVGSVLVALERAADARRKSGRRVPLSLVSARRHLGRPVPDRHPVETLSAVSQVLQPSGIDGPACAVLARELERIDPEGEEPVRRALSAVRRFLDTVWEALGDPGRAVLRDEAVADLGDLLSFVDGPTREALVDEGARDLLRRRYPALGAGTITALLGR